MSVVTEHLEHRGIHFEVLPHPRADTAMDEARAAGVDPATVVKVVVLEIRTGPALALVPSHRRLDLGLVRDALDDQDARFASEAEIERHFPEFELGAIPALPSLLHVPVVVDPELVHRAAVTFAAGVQRESVRVDPADALSGATVTVTPITREAADGRRFEMSSEGAGSW